MTQILGNLYLGGKRDVIKADYDIIFSILGNDEDNTIFENVTRMDDTMEQDIIPIIYEMADKLDAALNNGSKVLLHCHAGVSRSPALLIGYLMLKHGMTYNDAFMHIRMKRNICPNNNFIRQLRTLQR